MPAEVLEVTTRFMREPIRILVKKEELTLEGIRQVCPNYRNFKQQKQCIIVYKNGHKFSAYNENV